MARLHLFVFPVVFGSGTRLFAAMKLLAEQDLPAGNQLFPT